jgi:hypothetical protein
MLCGYRIFCRGFFCCFIFLMTNGCVSGVKVPKVTQSLEEIRSAIYAVAVNIKFVSANKRVYESQYFAKKSTKKFNPDTVSERLFARFTILGDRRPYQVLVEVIVEEKEETGYLQVDEDPDVAEKLAEELVLALSKSREDRNAIDSFRVF